MENNELTLDKIELVKDRTGVSYREAKEALEAHEGNVVDAIIGIEDTINASVKKDSKVNEIVDTVKEAVRKGNVSKIMIKKGDETVLNLPVNVGIVGTLIFPWTMLAAVLVAFGTKCTIELFKESGDVVNISEKAGNVVETVVTKGGVVFDEVKDKSSDFIDVAAEKGTVIFNTVKEKGGAFVDSAVSKGEDVYGMAKEKVANLRSKSGDNEPVSADDFDLSDLELDEMKPEDDAAELAAEVKEDPEI